MLNILSSISPIDTETYGNMKLTLRVLIECEKGSVHKCEYDDSLSAMVIVRDLHKKYPYPYNYGAIPQTLADDGDNLDAIVISNEPIPSGTLVNCFPIGIVEMIDRGKQDNKLICIPFYDTTGKINIKKIMKYLSCYKYPEPEGVTEVLGFLGAEEAWKAVRTAYNLYIEVNK